MSHWANSKWPCLSTANEKRGKRKCSDRSDARTPITKTCLSADAELEAARIMRWQSAGWISRAAPKQQPADDGSTLPEGETTSPVAVRTIGALEAGWLIITGSPAVERESTLSRPAPLPLQKTTAQHQKMEFGSDGQRMLSLTLSVKVMRDSYLCNNLKKCDDCFRKNRISKTKMTCSSFFFF